MFDLHLYLCGVLRNKRIDVCGTHKMQPTLFIKVDDGATPLAPRAQVHGSSLGDVWLAGVGFGRTNQNTSMGLENKTKPVLHGVTSQADGSPLKNGAEPQLCSKGWRSRAPSREL